MSRALVTTLAIATLALPACAPRTDTAPPEPVDVGPPLQPKLVEPAPEPEPTGTAELTDASGDVRTTLAQMGNFTTFLGLVEQAAQTELLIGDDLVTVFAPTDEAFRKLPAGQLDALMGNHDELVKFVRYHMMSGRLTGRELVDLARQQSMSGAELRVTASASGTPERIFINQATVVIPDLKAKNGLIHVIDAPLLPPDQASAAWPGR